MDSLIRNVNVTLYQGEEFHGYLNPFNLPIETWFALLGLKACGQCFLDVFILMSLKILKVPKMPSRTPPIMKGLQRLQTKDYLCLLANQVIETIFMMNWCRFFLVDSYVERSLSGFTLWNTAVSFYAIFLVDDVIYYFAHRIMHLPAFYPWCHKHHHRQSMPRRGYLDAANESPLEQIIGLSCVWAALYIVKHTVGSVHVVTGLVYLLAYAVLAFLNHTEYDISLGFLGLGYSVRAHEMHHRFPTCNYAQNTMIWDKILGTFQPYKSTKLHAR